MQATVSVNLLFVAWETKTVPKILPKISHAFQTALNIFEHLEQQTGNFITSSRAEPKG